MDFFQISSIILLAVFYAAYFLKQFLLKHKNISTNRLGRGNKPEKTIRIERLLIFFTVFMALSEIISIFFYPIAYSIIFPIYIRYIGVLLLALSNFFFIFALLSMKDSWRAGVDRSQKTKIITTGIYKISRNPAFVGFDLQYIGILLIFTNILTFIGSLACIYFLHKQILEEETFLPDIFGDEYLSYCKKTRRYI